MTSPQRPAGEKERSGRWYIPVAAIGALLLAYLIGTFVVNNRDPYLAANPADETSATGGSAGETGQNTIQNNPDAKANSGAVAAPAKAPGSNPDAADTQPKPQP
jgi:hypothetical protein